MLRRTARGVYCLCSGVRLGGVLGGGGWWEIYCIGKTAWWEADCVGWRGDIVFGRVCLEGISLCLEWAQRRWCRHCTTELKGKISLLSVKECAMRCKVVDAYMIYLC